jgi:DNA-binding beta-propeller fold protein YncE
MRASATVVVWLGLIFGAAWSVPARAVAPGTTEAVCAVPEADQALRDGLRAQQRLDTEDALASYTRCLDLAPACVRCRYELGWTYRARGEWENVVTAWQAVLEQQPDHAEAARWLPDAKEHRDRAAADPTDGGLHPILGTMSMPERAGIHLKLIARFQNFDANPESAADRYDKDIFSPKSVTFSADGQKAFVNSLEGRRTVVYDAAALDKVGTIEHQFGPDEAGLFQGQSEVFGYTYQHKPENGEVNQFAGKPVEAALSHGGKYLWVPYYRRDFDPSSTSPSAVAIIEVATQKIVRVMPTGPIPKYVTASKNGRWVAVTHWGDNTVGLIDVAHAAVEDFRYVRRLVVGTPLPLDGLDGVDRDAECGSCLRGTVFTPDGRTLLVARMGDGGIAGFDVPSGRYLGSVVGLPEGPRHLTLSSRAIWLFLSSNEAGIVSRTNLAPMVAALRRAKGKDISWKSWKAVAVGEGARTIALTGDNRYLFAAVNKASEIVVVDAARMKVVARVAADGFPVGLALSPDGRRLWATAQGRGGRGGNAVDVYSVRIGR